MPPINTRLPICSICQMPFEGVGNNAHPVNQGRCCNECDWRIVIPIRIRLVSHTYLRRMEDET